MAKEVPLNPGVPEFLLRRISTPLPKALTLCRPNVTALFRPPSRYQSIG
jgi:hypothetical protein